MVRYRSFMRVGSHIVVKAGKKTYGGKGGRGYHTVRKGTKKPRRRRS